MIIMARTLVHPETRLERSQHETELVRLANAAVQNENGNSSLTCTVRTGYWLFDCLLLIPEFYKL